MIAFIIICYAGIYFLLFNALGLIKKTAGNIAVFCGVGASLIGAIVVTWHTFAPVSGDARVFRYIVPIVPNVKGEVVAVPITANTQIAKGDTLFQLDTEPFDIAVRSAQAQLDRAQAERDLAQINVDRAAKLTRVQAAAQVDLDTWTAKLDVARAGIAAAQASLDDARWRLEETTVTAPSDGYVVNLQLRPGAIVSTVPGASPMAFVSTATDAILASFSQSAVRHIQPGDKADVVFTTVPGQTFSGTVRSVVGVSSSAQLSASSILPVLTGAPADDRWGVIVDLDDNRLTKQLQQGAGGTMAIYTQAGKPVHVISKIAVRMQAWLGYLTSP